MAGSELAPGEKLGAEKEAPSPEAFWRDHVVPRKPGLFPISADLAHLKDLWTDDYLTQTAGDAQLQVEQRGGEGEGFGKGHKVPLSFRDMLRRMAGGDASLYLTTQSVEVGPDGHAQLYASPIAELAGELPLVPALMGALVPQAINLWMGAARQGSSTGLHTDYHDNLYVLLRGRKRFRLYPPEAAKRMYTVGKVAAVHPNGRIVFKGQGDVLPDGSDAGEAAQWLARRAAEKELAAAEEAAAQGQPGAAKRLKAAERKLDAVLEAALGDDAFDSFVDDFDALEAPPLLPTRPATAGDPDSFCRVDLDLPEAQLRKKFPLFPGKGAAIECWVEAGQMLYLPAGWFHEVTSFSTADSPIHMALNFWYHPPDNLGSAAEALCQPYRQPYWPEVWEGRRAEYESRHKQPDKATAATAKDSTPAAKGGKAGGKRAKAAAAAGSIEGAEGQDQPRRSGRRHSSAAAAGSEAAAGKPLPGTYGLFGVGRKAHLHRFVTGSKRKAGGT